MQTADYNLIDRAARKWPPGPWDGEPDKVAWLDAATGFPCLALRDPQFGHWCGYTALTRDHPMYGKEWRVLALKVYGPVTFASSCSPEGPRAQQVSQLTPDGSSPVWWVGFHCSGVLDMYPGLMGWRPGYPDWETTYRTLAYVKERCAKLALQLSQMRPASECLSITRAQLEQAFVDWEKSVRRREMMSVEEASFLSVAEAAEDMAFHLWGLLGGKHES